MIYIKSPKGPKPFEMIELVNLLKWVTWTAIPDLFTQCRTHKGRRYLIKITLVHNRVSFRTKVMEACFIHCHISKQESKNRSCEYKMWSNFIIYGLITMIYTFQNVLSELKQNILIPPFNNPFLLETKTQIGLYFAFKSWPPMLCEGRIKY